MSVMSVMRVKREVPDWELMFSYHKSNKKLVSTISTELTKFNSK